MKRFAPFVAYLYLFSLFLPLSLRANVLPVSESTVTGAAADDYYKSSRAQLKVLSNDKVGQTLVASEALSSTAALSGLVSGAAGLAGVAYYERTGKDPVYAAFNSVASAADALFVPAYQAFKANFVSPESFPATAAQYVGVEGSVGATLGDLANFVQNSTSSAYSALKDLFSSHSTTSIPDSSFVPGAIYSLADGSKIKILSQSNPDLTYDIREYDWNTRTYTAVPGLDYSKYRIQNSSTLLYNTYVKTLNYPVYYKVLVYNIQTITEGDPIEPETSVDYAAIKEDLQSPSEELANAILAAIQNMANDQKITSVDSAPEAYPASSPLPITNSQVQNFFAQNTTNVYNKTLETITNNSTSETTEITNDIATAAAEAAKAQEEEATQKDEQEETEETFNGISNSGFAQPYNPGEFDIPARFTQFLNNVKSSGLFSFSSDFFNSLPGGGSSTYEIEAGQYGHHTIDLSTTMSTGLAILKTILLVCFGFLSIRVTIMKR